MLRNKRWARLVDDVWWIGNAAFQGEEALGVSTRTVRLSDLRGKPLVLNFWAGLVPPSRAEMSELQAFYDEFEGQLNVVGLDVGPFTDLGSNQDARSLLKDLGITYPTGFTSDENILTKYDVQALNSNLQWRPSVQRVGSPRGLTDG